MSELVGLVIIAILWFFFRSLGKANRSKPGQTNQNRPGSSAPPRANTAPRTRPSIDIGQYMDLLTIDEAQNEEPEHSEQDWREEAHGPWQGSMPAHENEGYGAGALALQADQAKREEDRRAARQSVSTRKPLIEPEKVKRHAHPLTAKRMRTAVIMAEIIAPPKSRRRRVS